MRKPSPTIQPQLRSATRAAPRAPAHHAPRRRTRAGCTLAAAALVACGPDDQGVDPLAFEDVVEHPEAAFMSVGGTADDVWVVGAQPDPLEPPVVLRQRGGTWEAVDTGQRHALWWVHGFEDGPVFLAGSGATVLRVDGDDITRTDTPPFFGNTIFGLWGASPDDLWAVGGFAGRDGFAWHYDGDEWTVAELPDDLPRTDDGEIPALFKVWGRAADDVWAVGDLGTVLHFDGSEWTLIPSETTDPLFTVFGTDSEVFAVGGAASGVFLRGGQNGLVDDSPDGAPLLQGLTVDERDRVWVAGETGYAATLDGDTWSYVDLGYDRPPQSVHALWSNGGALWAAGGTVLSPALDAGSVRAAAVDVPLWQPAPRTDPDLSCPDDAVDPEPDASMARRWAEQLLNSVRRDIPHPPVHARNILHTSIAMFDAWAAYQDRADGVVFTERIDAQIDDDVEVAIAYAAYRVLSHRYENATGGETSLDCYRRFMDVLGLDPDDDATEGDDAVAVGNRIGAAVIERFADDGANERNGYEDTTGWEPANPVMRVDVPGTNATDPNVWQQLNLGTAETQNGIILDTSVQPYIGPHWLAAEPFAITIDPDTGLYSDPMGEYPSLDDPEMVDWVVEVLEHSAELDVTDGVMMEAGPAGLGNNSLGENDGEGYDENPVTGEPYAPNMVRRGDFTRVVAEFWADGPDSETPPGHWLRLGMEVSDELEPEDLIPFGEGEPVDRLAWDVALFLTIGGAVHDAAISAWELKRDSLGPRPITLIRWMGQRGQRTDESLPSYDPQGLPLVPGIIELITEESAAPGERHHHLRWHIGEVAVWSWRGEPGDRHRDYTPLGWMRVKDWIPYQRRTFVTPAFPGFTSGHSTFSRAAAEALTEFTGSPYFPGGLFEWVAEPGYLEFEAGPSEEVRLQWATYQDAADQAGQSRIWGGIHIFADDRVGRYNGHDIGLLAAERAREYWLGTSEDANAVEKDGSLSARR